VPSIIVKRVSFEALRQGESNRLSRFCFVTIYCALTCANQCTAVATAISTLTAIVRIFLAWAWIDLLACGLNYQVPVFVCHMCHHTTNVCTCLQGFCAISGTLLCTSSRFRWHVPPRYHQINSFQKPASKGICANGNNLTWVWHIHL